jgi:hypothetical protein
MASFFRCDRFPVGIRELRQAILRLVRGRQAEPGGQFANLVLVSPASFSGARTLNSLAALAPGRKSPASLGIFAIGDHGQTFAAREGDEFIEEFEFAEVTRLAVLAI